VELWANGVITLTWVGTTTGDGVIGLAAGQVAPSPFFATDLSAYPPSNNTYAAWLAANFTPADIADPTKSGAMMDPDHDGWNNLTEYALGSDPHSPGNPSGAPVYGKSGGYLTITFDRNPFLSDVNYLVESSTLGSGWTVIAQSVAGAGTAAASGQSPSQINELPVNNVMSVTVGDTAPMAGNAQRFLRLRVTKP
jgi:hypothetical protein